ncbi:Clp protease N-terminal domain-containing protein, partial [Chromobacterium violaceum]
MSVSLKSLIDRLTPTARQAIEQAASRALARTHFEIEIEHVLLAMFDQDDNAALAALRALGADLGRVERELDAALDNFRSGNTRNPVLSSWLPKWLEKAWLLASAEHGQDSVSTLDLLLALWQDDALRGALQSGAPALARQDAGRLSGAYAALRQHGGEAAGG